MGISASSRRWLSFAIEAVALALLVASVVGQRGGKETLGGQRARNASLATVQPGHGRHANAPSEIPARGWKDIAVRTWAEFNDDHIPLIAAGITFLVLLAFFPALVSFISLYGLIADARDAAQHAAFLDTVLPAPVASFIGAEMTRLSQAHTERLGWALAIGIVISLWSANGAAKAMFLGLNIAYDEKEKRGPVALNLATFGFTLGLLGLGLLAGAALAGFPAADAAGGISPEQSLLRWPLQWVVAVIGFSLLYRFGPSRTQPRWRWITWGSALAAAVWVAASVAFTIYVARFANLEASYGPLAAAITFLIWIYGSVLVVLIGAELNAEIEHQTMVDSTIGAPAPMGARGAVMADTIGAEAGAERRRR